MPAARSSASHASVAFLKIHDFARHAIADQARLEGRLEEIVAGALPVLGDGERIVLDAPGGIAVVVLANCRGALRFAWRAADARDLDFSIGLAHGPVRLAPGPLHVVYGDALVTAEAVAHGTEAGGVSASREFRDALARSHPGMRRLLARAGSAIDAHDRAHDMFHADATWVAARRRTFFAIVGFVAVVVAGIGIAIRMNRPPPPPPPPPPEPTPGAVIFDVKPEGEVYIDGVLKGTSPPLKRVQLAAGKHVVELRSGTLKPMSVDLAIGPGEEFVVQHTFVVPPPPKPAPRPPSKPSTKRPHADQQQPQQEEKSLWRRFLDLFK